MNNLRDWLDRLFSTERLMICKTGADPKFEVMTWIEQFEGKKACFFPILLDILFLLSLEHWVSVSGRQKP